MRKIKWNKVFTLDNGAFVECGWQDTSYGFRHLAALCENGMRIEAKVCYYNRTWESYEYQSVLRRVIEKTYPKDRELIEALMISEDKKATGRINEQFGMIAGIAKLGEILCDKKEDQNAWKERMLRAGMPGLDIPEDFKNLPEDEKQHRLDGAIDTLRRVET